MQIVIDIDETIFKRARYEYYGENEVNHSLVNEILISIMNGTVLPKRHGRLIDADELEKAWHEEFLKGMKMSAGMVNIFNDAQTIIEADKEGSEGE